MPRRPVLSWRAGIAAALLLAACAEDTPDVAQQRPDGVAVGATWFGEPDYASGRWIECVHQDADRYVCRTWGPQGEGERADPYRYVGPGAPPRQPLIEAWVGRRVGLRGGGALVWSETP